jgi:hypothetical protein
MGTAAPQTRTHNWADILAIVTGMSLLGLAIWPGDPTASAGAARETGNAEMLWIAHGSAGALTIAGVFLAQHDRWRWLAKGLLILAGVGLIAVLVVFRDFGPRALGTAALPALALLLASTRVGPLPTGPD